MSKFFNTLESKGLYKDWILLLDWIFDDNRFKDWTSGYVGSFLKKVKRLPQISSKTFLCDSAKKLSFPKKLSRKSIKIIFTKGDGEARDLVRHIRNGIAHGNASIHSVKGNDFIEILDYTNSGKQTAYMFMPISYVTEIRKIYDDVKKSKSNDKNSNKKGEKVNPLCYGNIA